MTAPRVTSLPARSLIKIVMDMDLVGYDWESTERRAAAFAELTSRSGSAEFALAWLLEHANRHYELVDLIMTNSLDVPTMCVEPPHPIALDGLHLVATTRIVADDLRFTAACMIARTSPENGYPRVRHLLSHSGAGWVAKAILTDYDLDAVRVAERLVRDREISYTIRADLAESLLLGTRTLDELSAAVTEFMTESSVPERYRFPLAMSLYGLLDRRTADSHLPLIHALASDSTVSGLHRVQLAEKLLEVDRWHGKDLLLCLAESANLDSSSRELARRSLAAAEVGSES